jgi:hypothetical protein
MIFQPVAPRNRYIKREYFAYVHTFEVVPQKCLSPSGNQVRAPVPNLATGMWVLRRKSDQNGIPIGEVIQIKQIYTDVELAPRFRDRAADWTYFTANNRSRTLHLNHYCDTEVFYKFEL